MNKEEKRSACDWMGDCFLAIMQELSFWADVFRTTMEMDEESIRRDAEEKLKQFAKFENTATLADVQTKTKKQK